MRALSSSTTLVLALSLAACGGGSSTTDMGGGTDSGGGHDSGTDSGAPDTGAPDLGAPDLGTPDMGMSMDMGGTDGSALTNQCTNSADLAIVMAMDVAMVAQNCAISHGVGMEPATSNCIMMMSGLSAGCTTCYDGAVHCGIDHCLTECIGGASPACDMCIATNCDPAFFACSGLPMPDGGP